MQLTPNAIQKLKHFSRINQSVVIKAGSVISTKNPVGSVYARAELTDVFPQEFAIYDLNEFLGLLDMSTGEIDFKDKHMILTMKTGGKVKFFYTEPTLIKEAALVLPQYTTVSTFQLTKADFTNVKRLGGLLGASHTLFTDKDISLINPDRPASNTYQQNITANTTSSYSVRVLNENLSFPEDDYTVEIATIQTRGGSSIIALVFSAPSVAYLVAADFKSTIS